MTNPLKIFSRKSLFLNILIVMIVSIIAISVFLTYYFIQMSEKHFMETFSITNHQILEQIIDGLESYSNAAVTVANDIQNSITIKDLLTEAPENAHEEFKNHYLMRQQLQSINTILEPYGAETFIVSEDSRYSVNSMSNINTDLLVYHSVTKKAKNNPQYIQYSFYKSILDQTYNHPIIFATKALTGQTTDDIYGIVFISIEEEKLRNLYKSYTSESNEVLLMDGSGRIISSTNKEQLGVTHYDLLKYAYRLEQGEKEFLDVELFAKDYMLISKYLPSLDMYLINLIDKKAITANTIQSKQIIMISLGITLIALMVVFLITNKISKSLRTLINEISTMADKDFRQKVSVSGGYETEELGHAFNQMLDELNSYVNKIIDVEKQQRTAELRALQHQINPHFLYNTLTSVKILVQQEDKVKASSIISSLISLLQNTLGNINETITVEQEVNILKSYILINQARYGERIKVHFYIANNCIDYFLPKLILQPFIENAFFHGFNRKKEGFIQIMIAEINDQLVCEIVDNGDGMGHQETNTQASFKKKSQQLSGIGIKNVDDRIKLLYGNNYGVEISSQLNEGTKVHIKLPIIKQPPK